MVYAITITRFLCEVFRWMTVAATSQLDAGTGRLGRAADEPSGVPDVSLARQCRPAPVPAVPGKSPARQLRGGLMTPMGTVQAGASAAGLLIEPVRFER